MDEVIVCNLDGVRWFCVGNKAFVDEKWMNEYRASVLNYIDKSLVI